MSRRADTNLDTVFVEDYIQVKVPYVSTCNSIYASLEHQ